MVSTEKTGQTIDVTSLFIPKLPKKCASLLTQHVADIGELGWHEHPVVQRGDGRVGLGQDHLDKVDGALSERGSRFRQVE